MTELPPEVKQEQAKQQSIESFLAIMRTLDEYNKAHGLGAAMADAILEEMGQGEKRQARRDIVVQSALQKRDQAKLLGLDLDFTERKKVIMFGHPADVMSEGVRPKELRLTMVDALSFLAFLKNLDPEDLKQQSELQEKLSIIIDILNQQMVENYNPARLDDPRWKAMLDNAALLIIEFDRLDMTDRTKLLVQYMINSRRGTLEEFRNLHEAQCFQKADSGGFGPSEWHTDTAKEHYEARWRRTYDTIIATLGNTRAGELRQQAIENLIACAEFAIVAMERELAKPIVEDYVVKGHPRKIEIAKQYKIMLEQLREAAPPEVERD